MEDRLQWITLQPESWVHWDPLRGGLQAHTLVAQRYPKSTCYVAEALKKRTQEAMELIAPRWWEARRWVGGVVRPGLPPQPAQMLWANMALHMAANPEALIAQWSQLLAPEGFVMFSCLGPDTLAELRRIYARAGWPPPSHTFTDMHDWGDMLMHSGFSQPVMDMERITLSFASPQRLLLELRELGRNLHPQRFAALRGRAWHAQLCNALVQELGTPEGNKPLELQFEVIYGHAFKATARPAPSAETAVSLEEMRANLRQVNRK